MAIQITITDPTPAQLAAIASALGATSSPIMPEVAEKTKPTRAPKAKEVEKVEEPATNPAAEETEESTAADVPTLDDVRAAAQAIVAANGRDALAERLAQFGAANLSALPEDKRAEFIAHA